MLSKTTRRLRDRTVVTAAILSLMGHDVYAMDNVLGGSNKNGDRTESPIKHVIVILGENRTFDHVFATYEPRHPGERVDNLLSKGIITRDGQPGPNYARATQFSTVVNNTYSMNPTPKTPYNHTTNKVQTPGTSYAPQTCYTSVDQAALNGPGCLATLQLAQQGDYGLKQQDLPLLTTGATGLPGNSPDTRILDADNLPNGPYPLVTLAQGGETPSSLYKTYGGSPVHRFYQMWQQLDCDVAKATHHNPSGCQADLFTFVEQSVSSGGNGNPTPHALKEGAIALGFYNVAKGDAPYLTELARKYTLNDNFHQSVMGGTFANHMMIGYADALYYADDKGDPAKPDYVLVPGSNPPQYVNEIENPNPAPGTNNWYLNDGYGGGSYSNCSDPSQPGVGPIVTYLNAIHVSPRCAPNAYYLLNNYVPAFIGSGATDPINNGPFTLPPVIKQRHIGDALTQADVSWAYFGERWNDFKTAPGEGTNFGALDPVAYLYCNICNPFLFSASVMTHAAQRDAHMKDTLDLYDAIANGNLPAVSFAKPSTFNDGHPASSRVDLFEAFTRKIVDQVKSNKELWKSTAIVITMDEGGGYYDSGYVQPVDFFGDGTRIPLLVVSKYSRGGHVSHEYGDHVSITKFIERNWRLKPLGPKTRDALPNPIASDDNPYVPVNRPAIGDLFGNFNFADRHDDDNDQD
ncbi:alkaline phosphatase family protein [Bradyrhizobium manausense]|uniref:alkaline phosphatase family protein n=1 Tax=Bradyrhizobium manausense TaxID=989370 RepID=UPI001BAE46FC|nr:alkaline phosphatase family protein [Bradyrhizobium manausense]MBR0722483.1 phosphoesterase [Bradyrhizobium manausense]